MKATYNQIEKAVNGMFYIGTDGSQELYDSIKRLEDDAVIKVSNQVKKTTHYFTKSDWKKVHVEIKKQLG